MRGRQLPSVRHPIASVQTDQETLTLVGIPASLEEQPRIAELLRYRETLARLQPLHDAFGEALRKEQVWREIDSLDP